jgi:hypothetical protein
VVPRTGQSQPRRRSDDGQAIFASLPGRPLKTALNRRFARRKENVNQCPYLTLDDSQTRHHPTGSLSRRITPSQAERQPDSRPPQHQLSTTQPSESAENSALPSAHVYAVRRIRTHGNHDRQLNLPPGLHHLSPRRLSRRYRRGLSAEYARLKIVSLAHAGEHRSPRSVRLFAAPWGAQGWCLPVLLPGVGCSLHR